MVGYLEWWQDVIARGVIRYYCFAIAKDWDWRLRQDTNDGVEDDFDRSPTGPHVRLLPENPTVTAQIPGQCEMEIATN
jgi:hypothetical protein